MSLSGLGSNDGVGFDVRLVQGAQLINTLADALGLLDGTVASLNEFAQAIRTLNYSGLNDGIFLQGNSLFPGALPGQNQDNFAVRATGKVTIPAPGAWTFGVHSSDGFRLKVGDQTFEVDGARDVATSLRTFQFAQAGEYELELVYFERTGNATLELFAAAGERTAEDLANQVFDLVGDTANGGLEVRTPETVRAVGGFVNGLLASEFLLEFAPISLNGNYRLQLEPDVMDALGNPLNQDGDSRNGEPIDDRYEGFFTLDRKPLQVVATNPSQVAAGLLSQVEVTFSQPVDATSFGALDVQVFGNGIFAPILSVVPLNATTFRVLLQPISLEGDYTLRVGPDIRELGGVRMDQDGDGIAGEPEDRFQTTLRVENVGPSIREISLRGTVAGPVNSFTLDFSEPLSAASFTPSDVEIVGPSGVVTILAVDAVTGTQYRIRFGPITQSGVYQVLVGPQISDAGGSTMDQDGDGITGEASEDRFGATFTVDATGPRVVAITPDGPYAQPLSLWTLVFSEAVRANSLSTADVRVTGPVGDVGVARLDIVSTTEVRVVLVSPQALNGIYRIQVGPDILDLFGNAMDQDGDGILGEPADIGAGSVEVRLPNLVVTTLEAPPSVFNGDVIRIRAAVRTVGVAPMEVLSRLGLVLSADAIFGNGDDRVISTLDLPNPLAAGGEAVLETDYNVPFGISGPYRVLAQVDSQSAVVESDETDNGRSLVLSVQEARPPADLNLFEVTTVATAQTGSELEVRWQIKNDGTSETVVSSWTDRVYLSRDGVLDGQDILLGSVARTGALASGGNYLGVGTFVVPSLVAAGDYRILVVADALNQVQEPAAEANNTRASESLTLSVGADLLVTQVTAPSIARGSDRVDITWAVRNQGTGTATASWSDALWLSLDGSLQGASLLGRFERGAELASGGTYERTARVALPNLASGTYQILVVTDSQERVAEQSEANNTASSAGMTLSYPDLVPGSLTAPVSAQSGQAVVVRFTVTNSGGISASGPYTDRVQLLNVGNPNAPPVWQQDVLRNPELLPGGSYEVETSMTLPVGLEGNYRFRVLVDVGNVVQELGAEANNQVDSVPFAVQLAPYADLTVTEVSGPELVIGNPVDLTVQWKVVNRGTGAGSVDRWTDRVLLSRDATVGNGDDIFLSDIAHEGGLPVGVEYAETRLLTTPRGVEGRFRLYVVTDVLDVVYEHTNPASNVGVAPTSVDVATKRYADLVVNQVTAPVTALNGQAITVNWQVSNVGLASTDIGEWSDRVALSRSPEGTALQFIGSFTHLGGLGSKVESPEALDSYSVTKQVLLPADANGVYYVFVVTGGPYEFIYTNNNSRGTATPLAVTFVPPPPVDLSVRNVAYRVFHPNPNQAFDTDAIEVTWRVDNSGNNPIRNESWVDRVFVVSVNDPNRVLQIGEFGRTFGDWDEATDPDHANDQTFRPGTFYERTELVRLPHWSAGLFEPGLYRILVRTDAGNEVIELGNENNNRSESDELEVQILPRADLRVSRPSIPVEITSGGVVDFSFVVTNTGTVPTPTGNSRWTDRAFLSARPDGGSPTGDGIFLPNVSALDPGQSYSQQGQFRVSGRAAGRYFVVFEVDSGNVVDESPGEGNNRLAEQIAIDQTPVPPPDLVLASVGAPLEAFDGSTITVRYRVENHGAGVTFPSSWSDSLWLTRAKDRPNGFRGDIYLGGIGHNGALVVGDGYNAEITVRLPIHLGGQFFLTVWTNSTSTVFEQARDVRSDGTPNLNPDALDDIDGNNFRAVPFNLLMTPPSDLVVTRFDAPATAVGLQDVTVRWTVANQGTAKTDRNQWADLIYLSTTPTLEQGKHWLVFGTPHVGALEQGQSYEEEATFTLPPSAAGSYFIVQTNADPGRLLTNNETFLEQVDAIVKRAEQRLGKPLIEVRANETRKLTRNDLIFILTGGGTESFVGVWEGPYTKNNTRAAASVVTDARADLIVTGVQSVPTSFSGESIDVSWTVLNQGLFPVWTGTQRWTDYIYLSLDPVFDPSRTQLIGSAIRNNSDGMASGASYTGRATITLPAGIEGLRYLHVFAAVSINSRTGLPLLEGYGPSEYPGWPEAFRVQVWEGPSKSNNTGPSAALTVIYREADLRVTRVLGPVIGNSGAFLPIEFTVTNSDGARSRATRISSWLDHVFVSKDQSLDAYDALVGTIRHDGVLLPGASYTSQGQIRLPDNFGGTAAAPETYYLIVYADSPYSGGSNLGGRGLPYPDEGGETRLRGGGSAQVLEFAGEQNNTSIVSLGVVRTLPPDLVVSRATISELGIRGGTFDIQYQVTNQSNSAVPDRERRWIDYVFLSRDTQLDVRGDYYLGQFELKQALAGQDSYTVQRTFSVPRELLGKYYLIVLADAPNGIIPRGGIIEGSEVNNVRTAVDSILFQLPPPSDLRVDRVDVTGSGFVGDTFNVTWTVTNHGTERANGAWADSLFLSSDAVWDLGDALLRAQELPRQSLGPGESYTRTLNSLRIPTVLPRLYKVIVRTDIFDDIHEAENNRNNTTTSSGDVEVRVQELVPGIVSQGERCYYLNEV